MMTKCLQSPWLSCGSLLAIILGAAWLRLWRLAETPPGFWYDEAYNAMDAVWMWARRSPQIFLVNNTGREPLYHYLGAIFAAMLGPKPYTFRLLSALIGVLTIPAIYRFTTTLFADDPDRKWLGIFAAAGLTFSLWHLGMSRIGFRAILFVFVMLLTLIFFWRGWRTRSWLALVGSGVWLGLSQYTYLLARILPLLFLLYTIGFSLVVVNQRRRVRSAIGKPPAPRSALSTLWLGLIGMGFISGLVFLPLGLFFLENPASFFSRSDQIFIVDRLASGDISLAKHLLTSLSVLVGAPGDGSWRHNMVGESPFSLVSLGGFWLGVIVSVRRLRQAQYLFLLTAGLVLFLPGLLSEVSSLRLSGFLPIYYLLMAIGLVSLVRWWSARQTQQRGLMIMPTFVTLLIFSLVSSFGTINTYFFRWASAPQTYVSFDGPSVDLTHRIVAEFEQHDVILPYQLYTYPPVRLLLTDFFQEKNPPAKMPLDRPVTLVTIDAAALGERLNRTFDSSYVWLTRNELGQGVAYISRQQGAEVDFAGLTPVTEPAIIGQRFTNDRLATLTMFDSPGSLLHRFENDPDWQTVGYEWGRKYRLGAYQFVPDLVPAGQTLEIQLYWRDVLEQPWKYNVVFTIVDSVGTEIARFEQRAFPEEMFRWRTGLPIRVEHPIFISPLINAGPYLLKMALVNPKNKSIEVYSADERVGTDIMLGLLYVSQDESDPRQPPVLVSAQFGEEIELLGFAPPAPLSDRLYRGKVYWRANRQMNRNYLVSLQLLDSNNVAVSNWQAEPLAGQYPTSRWRAGEVVVDQFDLALSSDLKPDEFRLIVGIVDPIGNKYLPMVDSTGQSSSDDNIVLFKTKFE